MDGEEFWCQGTLEMLAKILDVHLVGLHEKLVPSKPKLKLKMGEAIH